MTNTPPVFLFPHTHISAKDLKKITSRLGRVTIFQPWFMEERRIINEDADPSLVEFKRPSDAFKPKEDFGRLVSEYRLWVSQNRDRGYTSFLGAVKGLPSSDETPWEIRKMISSAEGKGRSDGMPDQYLKWHIILHLARELEEKIGEAEAILERLRQQKSPLEGALEEDPEDHLLENVSPFLTDLRVDERHMDQVIEAWFGLFGEQLPENSLLVTLDPAVSGYVTGMLEKDDFKLGPESVSFNGSLPGSGVNDGMRKTLLPVITDDNSLNNPAIRGLSGKTIILLED